ncbi:hypothetical protein [Flavobacterium humidisoli]|uniref:Uncharacterized protein n=1 Tax=Flavobacterium humidisoli TaxID=2937442 RepID=A0ABY4LYM5_9FLAO|nr:hypothetical protein [Flavobacterium humidisoli]UPZ17917.1 hypothetical protein M0M44_11340 [Flavobacterium humidisoli]
MENEKKHYYFNDPVFFFSYSQSSGIGTLTPDTSAVFEIKPTVGGFLAPSLAEVKRDAIDAPAPGLMIYNSTENCLEFWNAIGWFNTCVDGKLELSANGTAKASTYNCGGSGTGPLSAGIDAVAAQDIFVTVTKKALITYVPCCKRHCFYRFCFF